MHGPGPSLDAPSVGGPQRGPVYCFVGTVQLFAAPESPMPGGLIGQLATPVGVGVPLVQTATAPMGPDTLLSVDHQVATLCGSLLFHDDHLALDVAYVCLGKNSVAPGVSPPALTVLALLGLLPTCD